MVAPVLLFYFGRENSVYSQEIQFLRPAEYDAEKSFVRSLTNSLQVRLQIERVVRDREDRQKIQIKPLKLPSSGGRFINLIWVHTKSTAVKKR